MTRVPHLSNSLVACAIALGLVASATAQSAMDVSATVIRVKGPARYSTGNNIWQPLNVGAVLKPGSVVQTGNQSGSFVDLVLGDSSAPVTQPAIFKPFVPSSLAMSISSRSYTPTSQQNVVRVWENTALGIDKLSCMQTGDGLVSDTQLDLKAGRITANVKKMSAASKYEIKLPNGVAGIRGTLTDVRADGHIKVAIGSVVAAMVDAKTGGVNTQVIMGGQQLDPTSGQVVPLSAADAAEISEVGGSFVVVTTGSPVILAKDQVVYPAFYPALSTTVPNPPEGTLPVLSGAQTPVGP